jgi:hypothetical protein
VRVSASGAKSFVLLLGRSRKGRCENSDSDARKALLVVTLNENEMLDDYRDVERPAYGGGGLLMR